MVQKSRLAPCVILALIQAFLSCQNVGVSSCPRYGSVLGAVFVGI